MIEPIPNDARRAAAVEEARKTFEQTIQQTLSGDIRDSIKERTVNTLVGLFFLNCPEVNQVTFGEQTYTRPENNDQP